MVSASLTDDQLLAWLDELLPIEQMSAVEKELRRSEALRRRVSALARRRDLGVHSVGEIWRRMRLSCPSRSQLGSFLLGTLDADEQGYVDFHLRTIGCRYCLANLADLEQAAADTSQAAVRRRKFFQSSAGHLRSAGRDE